MSRNLQQEKWNWALPDGLLRTVYASLYLNLEETLSYPAPGLAYTPGQDRTLADGLRMACLDCKRPVAHAIANARFRREGPLGQLGSV